MEPNPYESPLTSGGYEEEEPPDEGPPTFWDRFGFWIQLGLLLFIGGWLAALMLPPVQSSHPQRRRHPPREIEPPEENSPADSSASCEARRAAHSGDVAKANGPNGAMPRVAQNSPDRRRSAVATEGAIKPLTSNR
jgi:hypothetical protein